MVESNSCAFFSIIAYTSSAISGAFKLVFGSTKWYKADIVFENDLLVLLCKLLTAIRDANNA